MKKLITFALLSAMGVMASGAQNPIEKFDASGISIMNAYRMQAENPNARVITPVYTGVAGGTMARADQRVKVIVRLDASASASDVEAYGVEVTADLGDILVVNGTLQQLESLAEAEFVRSIAFGEEATPMLQASREQLRIDRIHSGLSVAGGKAFTGEGVMCGIFDTGIDFQHVNFRRNDDLTKTRIKAAWTFMGGQDVVNVSESLTEDEILSLTTDDRSQSHGTHTLGCMAGGYRGKGYRVVVWDPERNNGQGGYKLERANRADVPFYGMAPDADLLVAGGPLWDPNIIEGVTRIVDYAEKQGKTPIINLSLGSTIGPHDGTDAVSAALERLSDRAVIVMAAGNEGESPISIVKTFTAADNSFSTIPVIDNQVFSPGNTVTIYGNDAEEFTLTLFVYDKNTKEYAMETPLTLTPGREYALTTKDYVGAGYKHDAAFDKTFPTGSSFISIVPSKNTDTNNRYSMRLQYKLNTNRTANLLFGFKVTGKAGKTVYMTSRLEAGFGDGGQSQFTKGNSDFSISSMCCGKSVVSVGAWTVRNAWGVIASATGASEVTYGDLSGLEINKPAGFSSYGTINDGRKLPMVCAPGTAITSSMSTPYYQYLGSAGDPYGDRKSISAEYRHSNGTVNYWFTSQGTSMACPIVAGSVALWMQYDPTLTAARVRDIITETAQYDATMSNDPRWGAGKFDALAGMYKVMNLGINDVAAGADAELLVSCDGNTLEAVLPGAAAMDAALYSVAGVRVAAAAAQGDKVTVNAEGLAKGIYILNVNGHSRRVALN